MADYVLDSCCLLNLCAAGLGELTPVLSRLGLVVSIPQMVLVESRVLWKVVDDERIDLRIDLQPAINAGLVCACQIETDMELEAFVEFAVRLADADATCLALAKGRGWTLATDDRLMLRIARDQGIKTTTTPELMKRWADGSPTARREVARALVNIEELANYHPKAGTAWSEWWESCLANLDDAT
jgi:hypothetical protein